jgi:hypothetical protein
MFIHLLLHCSLQVEIKYQSAVETNHPLKAHQRSCGLPYHRVRCLKADITSYNHVIWGSNRLFSRPKQPQNALSRTSKVGQGKCRLVVVHATNVERSGMYLSKFACSVCSIQKKMREGQTRAPSENIRPSMPVGSKTSPTFMVVRSSNPVLIMCTPEILEPTVIRPVEKGCELNYLDNPKFSSRWAPPGAARTCGIVH